MKLIAEDGFIGPVKRLTCWHDHTGYHNNSRWIRFFGAHPSRRRKRFPMSMPTEGTLSVGASLSRIGEVPRALSSGSPMRRWSLTMPAISRACWGAIRGRVIPSWRGRAAPLCNRRRPAGTVSARCAFAPTRRWQAAGSTTWHFPIVHLGDGRDWLSSQVDLPSGRIEYVNPHRLGQNAYHRRNYYSAAVISHIVDFAETSAWHPRNSEYSDERRADGDDDGCRHERIGHRNRGKRLSLPLA